MINISFREKEGFLVVVLRLTTLWEVLKKGDIVFVDWYWISFQKNNNR